MDFVWFLLGLALGLGILSWHRIQLNFRLRMLIQDLAPELAGLPLSPISRLSRAIAAHQKNQHLIQRELKLRDDWFEMAPIGFIRVDEENQLIECNPQAERLLDMQGQSSRPRLLLELVRSYELDELIEQTRNTQQSCQREWTVYPVCVDPAMLPQQQPRPLRGYGFPGSDGCVAVFLESREEAVLLAKQRDRWISDVAHELKTPLTSIRLVAETLQSRLQPPLRDWIDRLLNETIRLSVLVQDLLDMNQLEAQPANRLSLAAVDLVSLVHSAWGGLELLAAKKGLTLMFDGPDRLVIQGDSARLHRMLLNLLDNAIKFSPPSQTIRVQITVLALTESVSTPGVQLDVIDSGCGFPDQDIPYLFERFYRVDPSRSRQLSVGTGSTPVGDATDSAIANRSMIGNARSNLQSAPGVPTLSSGSGLGLAIVRQIAEAHRGSVKATNHPETGGAWLQVFLPLESPH